MSSQRRFSACRSPTRGAFGAAASAARTSSVCSSLLGGEGKGELGMTLRRRMAPVVALALLLGQGAWHCARAEGPGGPAKKLPRSACDHAAFRVVVDVGHTAESPGAPSARGFWEYDFNLRLATLIKQKLLAAGFAKTVLLVTDGPARKSLFARAARQSVGCRPLPLDPSRLGAGFVSGKMGVRSPRARLQRPVQRPLHLLLQ